MSVILFVLCAATPARATEDLFNPAPPMHQGETAGFSVGDSFGLQGSVTRTRGADRSFQVPSLTLGGARVGFGHEHGVAVRFMNAFALGGGVKGVEGAMSMAVSGGWRAPVAKDHGPIVRGGLDASFFGNAALSDLRLELPQAHLGWQTLGNGKLAEIVGKGGVILFGWRHAGDAAERPLNLSPEVGALGTVQMPLFDLYVDYTHVFVRHEGGPLDVVGMRLCGKARPVLVCTNVRLETGDVSVRGGPPVNAESTFFGLLLGFMRPERQP